MSPSSPLTQSVVLSWYIASSSKQIWRLSAKASLVSKSRSTDIDRDRFCGIVWRKGRSLSESGQLLDSEPIFSWAAPSVPLAIDAPSRVGHVGAGKTTGGPPRACNCPLSYVALTELGPPRHCVRFAPPSRSRNDEHIFSIVVYS